MKRILFLLLTTLLTLAGIAQNKAKFTEDDLRNLYTTMQGDYNCEVNDSTSYALHLTPIWEQQDNFRWLYLEAVNKESQDVIEQKIIEIAPISEIAYKILVHDLRHPELFVGKWGNRNFFDGYNTNILKGKKQFVFVKTKDYEYQTNWNRRKSLKCFPKGDRIHFKFVKDDERFYIKRIPTRSTHIFGYTFIKDQTD